MKTIEIKGPVIDSSTGEFMSFFGANSYAYPSKLQDELNKADGEDITLEINSPGGVTSAGSEMYTALKQYSGNVEVHIVGDADSAASIIAMAGDKVLMSPTAMMMIHRAGVNGASGNTDDLASTKQALDQIDQNLVNVYADRTGKSKDEIYDLMSKTTWMNSETAVREGFADGLMVDQSQQQAMAPAFANATVSVPHLNLDLVNEFKEFMKAKNSKPKQEALSSEDVKPTIENQNEDPNKGQAKEDLSLLLWE